MTYYLSKVFWLLAAPTSALVLISGRSATNWAVLGNSKCAAWLAAAAACGLVIGAFTPISLALAVPLEFRFAPADSEAPSDGIILLGGSGLNAVAAVAMDDGVDFVVANNLSHQVLVTDVANDKRHAFRDGPLEAG